MDEAVRVAIRRIINEIPDPSSAQLVSGVLSLSLAALSDLAKLDESIYAHVVSDVPPTPSWIDSLREPGRSIRPLADASTQTFRGIKRLTTYLASARLLDESPNASQDPSLFDPETSLDLEEGLDFALAEAMATFDLSEPEIPLQGVDELDIDRAFDFVTKEDQTDIRAKVNDFRVQVGALGYALHKEHRQYEERIRQASSRGQQEVVLSELETARESLTEGLFALVTMTFQRFGADISHMERTALLPGYKTALEKALAIRKALADLRQLVVSENDLVIQDDSLPDEDRWDSIRRVAQELGRFIDSDVFRLMRAADRVEMTTFLGAVTEANRTDLGRTCEGLSKYLESLSLVNRREVLQHHDSEVIAHVQRLLEAARSLLMLNESEALALVREALAQTEKLYGRNPILDDQVRDYWANITEYASQHALERLIERLELFVR